VPIVLKSGSLKLLEPSGPVKSCNGIALPYIDLIKHFEHVKNIWKLVKSMKADLQVFSILALLEVRGQLHAPTAFNLLIKSPRSHCVGC
jgi:hypothetical protein